MNVFFVDTNTPWQYENEEEDILHDYWYDSFRINDFLVELNNPWLYENEQDIFPTIDMISLEWMSFLWLTGSIPYLPHFFKLWFFDWYEFFFEVTKQILKYDIEKL